MGFKLKQFQLFVDQQKSVFIPGEIISGNCLLDLEGQIDLSQLTIKLRGLAECKWDESHSVTEGDHSRTETVTYHNKQDIIDTNYSPRNVYPTVLTTGKHEIGFNFILPNMFLPNTYQGKYGHVSYYIKAHIHKKTMLSIDDKIKLPFTIQSPTIVPINELSPKVMNSSSKTVGLFGESSVSIECYIPRAGFNLGTSIPVHCFVDNHSEKSMTLKASLEQEVTFSTRLKDKKHTEKYTEIIGKTIEPKTQQKELLSLTVPVNAPLLQDSCKIIKISYIIMITLDIPRSFDLHCDLPVMLTDQQLTIDF